MSFSEWKDVKLRDICEIFKKSINPQENSQKEYRHFSLPAFDNSKQPEIQLGGMIKSNKIIVENGTILFNKLNVRFKRIWNIDMDNIDDGCICSTEFIQLKPIASVYRNYLYYILTSKEFTDWMIAGVTGTSNSHQRISSCFLLDTSILLPTLLEQKAIADTLSCLDDKIELNNRINKNLEEMAQAIFKSWFIDFEPFQDEEFEDSELGRIPKGWRVVELGSLIKFIKGKKPAVFSCSEDNHLRKKYLTIDVLNGGKPQYANEEKMSVAKEFDILMVMDGASSGTVYFGLSGIVASTIGKIEVENEQLREVIYQYLKISETEIKSHNTGSAIPHTDKGYVSRCKIVIPHENTLKEAADIFMNIRSLMLSNMLQRHVLMNLRDTLLPKLMSGEIRVPIEEVQ